MLTLLLRNISIKFLLIVLLVCLGVTSTAYASESSEQDGSFDVQVSAEGERALIEGSEFALDQFSRANAGTNRDLEDAYRGYNYIQPSNNMIVLIDTESYIVVYVPADQLEAQGLSLSSEEDCTYLQVLLQALDAESAGGNVNLKDEATWYFTSETTFSINNVTFSFEQEFNGRYYTCIIGDDGSDITDSENPFYTSLSHADFAVLTASSTTVIDQAASGLDAVKEFFDELDFSPLMVTLKTTGTAIVIIFFLGILVAWGSLYLPSRWQSIADAIFTIPMVLPPTVCGFILLLCLGSNSPIGQWFNSIGFPLIFSWPATVIAAVVVAFPLMYRSARGAFESLDADMLDAARTLGWSETRVFFKLMLPLAWSSIAAGTMLAFARALGEFGATLFLAGNYIGITRTIPIAIYFEWMGGHTDAALFWTFVVIVLSFLVIVALNLWSKRTTRYRRKEISDESEH